MVNRWCRTCRSDRPWGNDFLFAPARNAIKCAPRRRSPPAPKSPRYRNRFVHEIAQRKGNASQAVHSGHRQRSPRWRNQFGNEITPASTSAMVIKKHRYRNMRQIGSSKRTLRDRTQRDRTLLGIEATPALTKSGPCTGSLAQRARNLLRQRGPFDSASITERNPRLMGGTMNPVDKRGHHARKPVGIGISPQHHIQLSPQASACCITSSTAASA